MKGRNTGGLHVMGTGPRATGKGYSWTQLLDECVAANCPVGLVKMMDSSGREVLAHSPQTTVVARTKVQGDDNPPGDGQWAASASKAIAQAWMDKLQPFVDANRQYVTAFEFMNEFNWSYDSQADRVIEFMQNCAEIATARGFIVALGSFSAGCPSIPHMSKMVPLLDYAREHGHYLAFHDGSVNPSRPLLQQGAADGTALRHRYWATLGVKMPRCVITEMYIPNSIKKINYDDYRWYLLELSKDGYVDGSALYTLGGNDDANIVGRLPAMSTMMTNTVWPELAPTPPPTPGSMTVQQSVEMHGGLKVRSEHNLASPIMEALPAGAKVTALELPLTDGGFTWLKVRTESGNEGWVRPFIGGETYLI